MNENNLSFWYDIFYFKPREFASPDSPGSVSQMKGSIIKILDIIRTIIEKPMIIKSGFRTSRHNIKIKGSSNSAHLRGYAADIQALTPDMKFLIVKTALLLKVRHIGIYENHIHIDTDPNPKQDVLWYGKYKPKK